MRTGGRNHAFVLLEDGTRFDGEACGAGVVTSRARSRPIIDGSASTRSRASASGVSAPKMPPRIAPSLRMWRTSARVSTSVIAGLGDGTIDCIATDHAPHAPHEKEVPFEEAPMGTTGLETAFAALNTFLVEPGVVPLALVVEKLTSGAAVLDLPVPRIAAGEPANLALVGLGRTWQPVEAGYESRSANCCFGERELRGRVLMTVAAGAIAYRERSFALSPA